MGIQIKIGVVGLSFNMKNDKKLPNTWEIEIHGIILLFSLIWKI